MPVSRKRKKKHPKMDSKLVAQKQKHEIAFIANKWGIAQKIVKEIVAIVGRSRYKIEAKLKELGYSIKVKEKK